MRILVTHRERIYRLLRVVETKRDGSLVICMDREAKSTDSLRWGSEHPDAAPVQVALSSEREVTVHQSGRVNFHESGDKIFLEPLLFLTQSTTIFWYRIPAIDRLDILNKPREKEDIAIDLDSTFCGPCWFALTVGPSSVVAEKGAAKKSYLDRYALLVARRPSAPGFFPLPAERFFTVKPTRGTLDAQAMAEDQALIEYHRVGKDPSEMVIHGPNQEGVYHAIFPVVMRVPPNLVFSFEDSDLFVAAEDVVRDSRLDRASVRFKVRRRSTNELVRYRVPVQIVAAAHLN